MTPASSVPWSRTLPKIRPGSNLLPTDAVHTGDAEAAFGRSDVTLEGHYKTGFQAHMALEREAALGYVDEEGRGAKALALDSSRELISHLRFPLPGPGWGSAWQRTGRRSALTLPTLNCASTVQLSADGARILAATLALGPVAQLPFRVRAAEAALLGEEPLPTAFGQAALIAPNRVPAAPQPPSGLTRVPSGPYPGHALRLPGPGHVPGAGAFHRSVNG